ncbi:MAG: hypothetical protein IPM52_14540 [Bacteroidetes bacterium]|nr:hypothetical protein [Bacteroidota bacterium]
MTPRQRLVKRAVEVINEYNKQAAIGDGIYEAKRIGARIADAAHWLDQHNGDRAPLTWWEMRTKTQYNKIVRDVATGIVETARAHRKHNKN